MIDFTVYCLITLLCVFIDNIIPHINVPIIPIILFINLIGLYLIYTRIHIDINICYRNRRGLEPDRGPRVR